MDTSTDQPAATEEEQEEANAQRGDDEEAMRGPGHEDPEQHGSDGEDGV
jgi:hypothetical protein